MPEAGRPQGHDPNSGINFMHDEAANAAGNGTNSHIPHQGAVMESQYCQGPYIGGDVAGYQGYFHRAHAGEVVEGQDYTQYLAHVDPAQGWLEVELSVESPTNPSEPHLVPAHHASYDDQQTHQRRHVA